MDHLTQWSKHNNLVFNEQTHPDNYKARETCLYLQEEVPKEWERFDYLESTCQKR